MRSVAGSGSSSPDSGILYLVSTPIGNLTDLSPRGLEVLGRVPAVYAEDTRRTLKLMRHFDLNTPLISLHAHNERERTSEVLAALHAGSDCALVTDAGTPGVSDPGAALVSAVVEAGFTAVPIPGPSAVLAALAASGFGADQFMFLGFPPRKGRKRDQWLRRCADADMTVVAFESPHRVGRLLDALIGVGLGDAPACVCRELTKLHEEVRRGTVAALAGYYKDIEVRGEVTLVVERGTPADERADAGDAADAGAEDAQAGDAAGAADEAAALVRDAARRMAGEGATTVEIAGALKREFGLARNAAYDIALAAAEPARHAEPGEQEAEPT